MKGSCEKVGCTVEESGICLLSHDAPWTKCPHFKPIIVSAPQKEPKRDAPSASSVEPGGPPSVAMGRRFHAGSELGTEDAVEVARARYCHLVGVLGAWDAGKTCFLLSLYMMASRASLPVDYLFAGSLTLKGFEERARRLRNWKEGQLPDQLADHTHLAHDREPAILHLALREKRTPMQRFDVMLTDLPGEWTSSLVDRADTAKRFRFLRRADGIIIAVSGPSLLSTTRHSEMERTKHLMDRLIKDVGIESTIPVTLLLTKCDEIAMQRPKELDELVDYGRTLGLRPNAVLSAAFSRTPDVGNGTGVFEALGHILHSEPTTTDERRSVAVESTFDRHFLRYGSGHK